MPTHLNQILTSRHGLLHQVDKSKTTMGNYDHEGEEIHLETPHMLVRSPSCHCHGQPSSQSSNLRRLLGKARYEAPSHLCRKSSDQRSGRGS